MALSCTHVPPLVFASVCNDVPTPLLATARFSASNIRLLLPPPPPVVTFNAAPTLCVALPLAPEIVSDELPVGVDEAVVTVSVDEPGALTETGLNEPVALDGKPETARLTGPANPLMLPTFTV